MRRVLEVGNPLVGIFAARVWERRAFADELRIRRRRVPLRPRAAQGPQEFLQCSQLMRVSTRERGQQRRLPVSNTGGPRILVAERDRSVALPPCLPLLIFDYCTNKSKHQFHILGSISIMSKPVMDISSVERCFLGNSLPLFFQTSHQQPNTKNK